MRRIFAFRKIGGVALIAGQQPQKVFPALRTQDRIAQRGVLQLNIEKPDLGDDKGRIIQIDGIAHLAGKRQIYALPVIGRGHAFIGRRCVFQYLHPAGKRLIHALSVIGCGYTFIKQRCIFQRLYPVGKCLIHALSIIGRSYAFIGPRCVFQFLHPAGKRLHFLNERAGVQRVLVHNFPVHNSCLCQTAAQGFGVDGFFIILCVPVFVTVGLFPGQLLRHRLIGQLLRLFPLCQVLFLLRGQVTLQPNDFRKAGSDLGPGKANLFTVLFPPADALAIKGFFAV